MQIEISFILLTIKDAFICLKNLIQYKHDIDTNNHQNKCFDEIRRYGINLATKYFATLGFKSKRFLRRENEFKIAS